jgi:hypothetical protein
MLYRIIYLDVQNINEEDMINEAKWYGSSNRTINFIYIIKLDMSKI